MTAADFQAILAKLTDKYLNKVASNPSFLERNDSPGWGKVEFPAPATWDINCGWCEEWANAVEKKVPGAVADWYDINDNDHCLVVYEGRYYDAECPQGVDKPEDLPIYNNAGRTRLTILTERQKLISDLV